MIGLTPERIMEEIQGYHARLTEGMATLRNIGEIEAGVSPRDAVYREDKLTLYRYQPRVAQPRPIPLLIVYALVNRPYMMDIQEDRSMIRGLLEAGIDVYLIDWGYPDAGDRNLTLADYIHRYIGHCVDFLRERHQQDTINQTNQGTRHPPRCEQRHPDQHPSHHVMPQTRAKSRRVNLGRIFIQLGVSILAHKQRPPRSTLTRNILTELRATQT